MYLDSSSPQKSPRYDLRDRTFAYAKNVRSFVKRLRYSASNTIDSNQLLRSSGSVGANYIEANQSISKDDFVYRIKICRKEAGESEYWLKLMDVFDNQILESERKKLIQETKELTLIFAAILRKSA